MNVPGVDRDLLERARAGDSRAFGELIRPHVPSVRRFAYAFARRWSDADDLAQEALAHTLAYDATIMADYTLPAERAAKVEVPTIAMAGGASFPWMSDTARALADVLPHGEVRILEGQTHDVSPDVMASVLTNFFGG